MSKSFEEWRDNCMAGLLLDDRRSDLENAAYGAWHARDEEVAALVEAGKWAFGRAEVLAKMLQEDHGRRVESELIRTPATAHAATLAAYEEGGKDGRRNT